MRPYLLHLPERPEDLPRWLEDEIVAGRCNELAEEAAVVFGDGDEDATLESVLGRSLERICQNGLEGAAPDRLLELLRTPRLLLELHEVILERGGAWWATRFRQADPTGSHARIWKAVQADIAAEQGRPMAPAQTIRRMWSHAIAVAAAVLLCFGAGYWLRVLRPVGWQDASLFDRQLSAKAYGESLARAALEFRPSADVDRKGLLALLARIDDGCARFRAARHRSFDGETARRLTQSCDKWRTAFREFADQLRNGGDLGAVRNAVDLQVLQMASSILDRTSA